MPFNEPWFLSANIFFAVCPLSILLFAFEMSALDTRRERLSKVEDELRFLVYFFKLPGSLLIPLLFGNVGGVVIGILDVISIIDLIIEAKYEISIGMK